MNHSPTLLVCTLCLGLGAGVLSGMFGIGGGLVIVPSLILLFSLDTKTATGTSLLALLLPTGLLGLRVYWQHGQVRVPEGLIIAFGLFLGAYFGAKITAGLDPEVMKRIYGIFLLVVGTYFLLTAGSPQKIAEHLKPRSAASIPATPAPPSAD